MKKPSTRTTPILPGKYHRLFTGPAIRRLSQRRQTSKSGSAQIPTACFTVGNLKSSSRRSTSLDNPQGA